jgi:hypothetical protein
LAYFVFCAMSKSFTEDSFKSEGVLFTRTVRGVNGYEAFCIFIEVDSKLVNL